MRWLKIWAKRVAAARKAGHRREREVCRWAGEHSSPQALFLLSISRDCGHVEEKIAVCLGHAEALLGTGGLARYPAPCLRAGCLQVSRARVSHTEDLLAA